MLIQFSLKNCLSFKDETVLDMTAINAYKEHEYNLMDIGTKEKYLRVAAIYGANASGKSNLYIAFHMFQRIIAESLNNVSIDEETAIKQYYQPFLFDQDENNTEFEIVLNLEGYEYKYGFEYNSEKIVSEWMYRKNNNTNRNTVIYERNEEGQIDFGTPIRKQCAQYGDQIPQETLLLSFFKKLKLKIDIFNQVYNGIMDIIAMDTDFYENLTVVDKILPEIVDNDKGNLLKFLMAIDTGIKDINYEQQDSEKYFFTIHKDTCGNAYKLPLLSESEGTIKSIIIYIYAKAAVRNDKSLFVDELNVKLHPLLLKFIIDLFYEETSKAQLIYTTHDTTLLDKKFFRRDQIWFVQKDAMGHSELNALSDYKIRSDASFEKDYLAGVYGGIPFLKEFSLKEGE